MKKILVATGSSEHKKQFAVDFIQDYMNKKGFEATVEAVNIYEMKLEEIKPDLIVTIGPVNFTTDIPIVAGTCFLTKFGMEPVCDSMIAKLS